MKKEATQFSLGSLSNTIKGFLVIGFVVHHLSEVLHTCQPLSLFRHLGLPMASVFFFIAGYDALDSYLGREKRYVKDRYIFYLCTFIFFIFVNNILMERIHGTGGSFLMLWEDIATGGTHILLPFSWYILTMFFLQFSLYLVFHYVDGTRERKILLFLSLCTFGLIVSKITKFSFRWYNNISILCFIFGVFWKFIESDFFQKINKKKALLIMVFFISLLYIGGLNQMLSLIIFPPLAVIFCFLISFPSIPFMHYLGEMSYEIFIVHAISILLLEGDRLSVTNNPVFIGGTILGTLVLAFCIDRLKRVLLNIAS
jgi:hypothetical protein